MVFSLYLSLDYISIGTTTEKQGQYKSQSFRSLSEQRKYEFTFRQYNELSDDHKLREKYNDLLHRYGRSTLLIILLL